MNIEAALNLEDIRQLARRKLPKIAFDFIDGGADDEHCLRRNRDAFSQYNLVPRYLIDVSRRDQSVDLLGHRYDSPIGISPTGLAGLFRPDADCLLAQAAVARFAATSPPPFGCPPQDRVRLNKRLQSPIRIRGPK